MKKKYKKGCINWFMSVITAILAVIALLYDGHINALW